ncbi:hypothetical protein SNE40_007018 [Patella caerulea]|uniref:Uncharacterized protein n=1 Tax=Patella caerulea TaxID=87958 RepID=A0AAN8JX33_PATCE
MANRKKALQLMIQKYGEDEAHLATRTNLMYIPWKVLFDLANITDPRDVTGRRDYHVVGEGFGLTSVEIIAIHERKRESSVTMAIFEAVSRNGKTYMDLLVIWLQHTIDGINKILESWPETLQRKRGSELRNCNPRASFLTPVQTSWDCPPTLQSNHRFTSRRNNIPDEHHSCLHWQPDNFNDDDNESIVRQSNENNLSAGVAPHRPGTQYRPNIESSDSSNHVPSSPWQRVCEPGSNPTEGGNIPTFIQQNISFGDDDASDEHQIVDHQVNNLTSSSLPGLEHQIMDQQKPNGAHRMQNVGNGSEMPLNGGSINQEMALSITDKIKYIKDWCKNNPLTREEQWKQSMTWSAPSTVPPTEPEVKVKEVQVFICGDDNEKNRTIADKLAAKFTHEKVSFVSDEPSRVKGFPRFSQKDRQTIPGDSEKFIEEVFKNAKFVLLLQSKGFMKYISVASRSKDSIVRKHQERLCNIFSWIEAEQRERNRRPGRLLLLETDRQFPPKFISKLYDLYFKRNED